MDETQSSADSWFLQSRCFMAQSTDRMHTHARVRAHSSAYTQIHTLRNALLASITITGPNPSYLGLQSPLFLGDDAQTMILSECKTWWAALILWSELILCTDEKEGEKKLPPNFPLAKGQQERHRQFLCSTALSTAFCQTELGSQMQSDNFTPEIYIFWPNILCIITHTETITTEMKKVADAHLIWKHQKWWNSKFWGHAALLQTEHLPDL